MSTPTWTHEVNQPGRDGSQGGTAAAHFSLTLPDAQASSQHERLSRLGAMAAIIAHDLTQQITVIRGAADLAADGVKPSDMFGMLRRSADRMSRMVQEITEYSRGTTMLRMQEVLVAELTSELEEIALSGLEAQGICVERHIRFQGALVADRDRLVRALVNVIRNAADAMPGGGSLSLAVDLEGDSVAFTMADDGAGIPEHVLAVVFEPFATYGKQQGTGLGLVITKGIVDAHGGTVSVASTPGEGTTVVIAIPRRPV